MKNQTQTRKRSFFWLAPPAFDAGTWNEEVSLYMQVTMPVRCCETCFATGKGPQPSETERCGGVVHH